MEQQQPSTSRKSGDDDDPSQQEENAPEHQGSPAFRPPQPPPQNLSTPSRPSSPSSPPSPSQQPQLLPPTSSSPTTSNSLGRLRSRRRRRLKVISIGASVIVGLGVAATVVWVVMERTKPTKKAYIQGVADTKYYLDTGEVEWYSPALCLKDGKTLAMIKTYDEAEEFKTFLNQNEDKLRQGKDFYWAWIGVNDQKDEGRIKWVDGTDFKETLFGQPKGNSGSKDCGVINRKDGHWVFQLESCKINLPYICQTTSDKDVTTVKPPPSTTAESSDDYEYFYDTTPDDDGMTTLIIIGVVVLLVAVGTAVWWYRKNQEEEEQERQQMRAEEARAQTLVKKKKEMKKYSKREDKEEEPRDVVEVLKEFAVKLIDR